MKVKKPYNSAFSSLDIYILEKYLNIGDIQEYAQCIVYNSKNKVEEKNVYC